MNKSITMSIDAFLRPGADHDAFGSIVLDCLAYNLWLRMSLRADEVQISLHQGQDETPGVTLHGHWGAPELDVLPDAPVSAQLFMPFLFGVSQMEIHSSEIVAPASPHRAAINFFVRNLFLAIGRRSPITCHGDPADTLPELHHDFRLHYMYLFKHIFPETCFDGLGASEATNMIFCNGYLPLLSFENDLLSAGAERLRDLTVAQDAARPTAPLKRDLLQLRDALITHF